MVENSLQLAEKRRRRHVVLLGEFRKEKSRIIEFRMCDGIAEAFHQECNNPVAGKFNVDDIRSTVDLSPRQVVAAFVAFAFKVAHMAQKRRAKRAVEDGILILDEGFGTLFDKCTDNTGAQICYFFIGVAHSRHRTYHTLPALAFEESEKSVEYFGGG